METINFDKLLLKTAFSCMACDGDIDKREIKLIKKLHKENKTFGDIDFNSEMDNLLLAINKDGHQFLKQYFNELTSTELTQENELKLIEVAIETIKADNKVEYSEIKFFKVIRSKLKIENKAILEKHPDFEDYLEQDIISTSYLSRLQDDFFDTHISNEFELISKIDDDTMNSLKQDNEK
ncbi:TerB family tellurite resistance protein [Lacinutrix himadriensis]|uniref:tellurite resistance TerB family protein n=1 Tax=Lacinutrix himadriensis TaxID=641549 RepID=UPI0006E43E7A|nr:TerB family tellurite resistance protein [Lacinutrix himadriensis]